MNEQYETHGIFTWDGEHYVGMDKENIIKRFGFMPEEGVIEIREGMFGVSLPYFLTGDPEGEIYITPMRIESKGDNIIPPNEDGSYTLEFKDVDNGK